MVISVVGMMVFNTAYPVKITLENTGVINASSDIPASPDSNATEA